jgi:hypothetical protein
MRRAIWDVCSASLPAMLWAPVLKAVNLGQDAAIAIVI